MPEANARRGCAESVLPVGASEFREEARVKVGPALGTDEPSAADVRVLRSYRERYQPDSVKLHGLLTVVRLACVEEAGQHHSLGLPG